MALSVQAYASRIDARVDYLRTRGGEHEIDFIVHKGQDVVAVEVKLSPSPRDVDLRHLVWLRSRLGDRLREAICVTTGARAYRRAQDSVIVVPAALLGP